MCQKLSQADFDRLREMAPLVSIDLIVDDDKGRVLLGRRKNEPAKGTWFVPGGRIRKDERLSKAFERIVDEELRGIAISRDIKDATFVGVFEHHYPAAQLEPTTTSIHYVVLAYSIDGPKLDPNVLPVSQHSEWTKFEISELLRSEEVHDNTKAYFRNRAMLHKDQYPVVAGRQQSLNTLLWQTPALSLTAQAFLFTIAFSELPATIRFAPSFLIVLVATASLQLMAKHRKYEEITSKQLGNFENAQGYALVHDEFGNLHSRHKSELGLGDRKFWASRRSYDWWIYLLWVFWFAGLGALILSLVECFPMFVSSLDFLRYLRCCDH